MVSPARPAAVLVALAASLIGASAAAEESPEGPRSRWHPRYAIELEAHGSVAAFDRFFVGLGGGARASFPAWHHTPFKGFDNDLGVSIGLDVIRYWAYRPADPNPPEIRVVGYYVPVALQWNVWLGSAASIFVEPTLMYRYATYIDSCAPELNCAPSTRFIPTGSVGLRFRVVDRVAGTIRIGWPVASIGASWL